MGAMEVEKSSRRSCFTQTSCLGADLGDDSQLEYLSAHEEYEEEKSNWSEFSELGEVGEVKAVPLLGDKVPPQITAGEEDSGKSLRPTQSVAVEPDSPFLPPREGAQLCQLGEPSYFSSCEKPAACTRGTSSTAEDTETQLPAPEILPGKNPVAAMEAADKSCGGSPRAGRSERGDALRNVPSVTVDAGCDPRAGFLTSRSSSAQVCLFPRAVSTEVTVMSKAQPVGWLGQTSVDAASNTEWSPGALSSHLQVMDTKQEGPPDQSDRTNFVNFVSMGANLTFVCFFVFFFEKEESKDHLSDRWVRSCSWFWNLGSCIRSFHDERLSVACQN